MFVNYSAWFWNLSETSFFREWVWLYCCCCWFNEFNIPIFSSSFVRSFPHWSAPHWSNENEIYAQNWNAPIRLACDIMLSRFDFHLSVWVCLFVCFFDYLAGRLTDWLGWRFGPSTETSHRSHVSHATWARTFSNYSFVSFVHFLGRIFLFGLWFHFNKCMNT